MGEFYALICAVLWAFAVILFKRSGETIAPFALNLFRVGVSSVLLVVTVVVAGQDLVRDVTTGDLLLLVGGGVLSIALADTMFHKCLNTVGAGITAIVDCLYSPLMILFAFLMLDERIRPLDFAGMGLVVGAVLIASTHPVPEGLTRRRLVQGVLWGAGAMTTLTLGVIIVKPVLSRQPVLWATAVRQLGALAVMIPFALLSPKRRELFSVFIPRRNWTYSLTGTVFGSYLALIFWLAGFKHTEAGVAAILNQTSTIYVLILATLFLKESFTKRKMTAAVMAVGGILVVTTGCAPSEPPNVVLVTLDTLRADRIAAYGHDRDTLPALEEFMADAVRFENAQTVTPLTAPSHATMLTGLFPAGHGVTKNGWRLDEANRSLPEVLSEAGYRTGGFVSVRLALGGHLGFGQGFDEYSDGDTKRRSAPDVVDDALAFLDGNGEAPFFLWTHFYDIHCPYRTPRTFAPTFSVGISSGLRTIGKCDDVLVDALETDADLELVKARYDEGIAFVDMHLERLWQRLEADGLLENTVVIVTSDHGEELHEQGRIGHNYSVNEWETHIPLWIRVPGRDDPIVIDETVSTLDLYPTILALAGLDPDTELAGSNLKPLLDGGGRSLRRALADRAVFARVVHDSTMTDRRDDAAIRRGAWKLHTDPATDVSVLFDLDGRATELVGPTLERPDLAHELGAELGWWLRTQDEARAGVAEQTISDETRRQLEALGY